MSNVLFPSHAGPFAPEAGLLNALGMKSWNYNPSSITSNAALTSQTIFCSWVPTVAGTVYTGVKLWVTTAGTSTAPTGFFVGLATNGSNGATGTMLAQSSNLNSSASLTTNGLQTFAFNATYTETQTGLRQFVLLQNGVFAGTNVAFYKAIALSTSGQLPSYTAGTGQTALPGNGNSLPGAFSATSNNNYFAALY
jgi:hypothetical protein